MTAKIEPITEFHTTNAAFVVREADNGPILVTAARLWGDTAETTWKLSPHFTHFGEEAWEHHPHHRHTATVTGEDNARRAANELAQVVHDLNKEGQVVADKWAAIAADWRPSDPA